MNSKSAIFNHVIEKLETTSSVSPNLHDGFTLRRHCTGEGMALLEELLLGVAPETENRTMRRQGTDYSPNVLLVAKKESRRANPVPLHDVYLELAGIPNLIEPMDGAIRKLVVSQATTTNEWYISGHLDGSSLTSMQAQRGRIFAVVDKLAMSGGVNESTRRRYGSAFAVSLGWLAADTTADGLAPYQNFAERFNSLHIPAPIHLQPVEYSPSLEEV